jgi:GT2 family glycosyltransferase
MGEEFVLANQVNNTHGKIYYDADLKVLHNENSSMGKIPSKKVYEFNRNAYNIVKNYF